MSAAQYDVVDNPAPRVRRAFPFVVILQSDLADTGSASWLPLSLEPGFLAPWDD